MRDDDRVVDDERVMADGGTPDVTPGDDGPDDELVAPYGESVEDEFDESDQEPVAEAEAHAEPSEPSHTPAFIAPVFNNFMDVLYPAKPPAAKNARIVRRFDLEAAKYDPRPGLAPAPFPAAAPEVPEKKEPVLSREEMRAMRNRSLRAAAGLG
ncbi:MAG TPA: hypothetical protein VFB75_01400 [Burkholderiales bacterium]|nr:hypothetical protein [Burkholderiales bacterium]